MWYSYSETITLLYSSYTFDFRYPHTVSSFSATVPRHRLDRITSLQLTCDFWNFNLTNEIPHVFPKDQQGNVTLEDICELLANLQGLKVLRIEHLDRDRNVYRNHRYEPLSGRRKDILQAMCLIQQTKVFAFKCPWAEDIKKEFGEAPMPFNLV
jgi:hypothetical protein